MNKEEFDRLFDSAFEEAAKKLPSVNPDSSWPRVEAALRQRKARRTANKLIPYAVVAASFMLGAIMFSTPSASTAFSPLVATVKNMQSDVVSFIFGNRSGEGRPAKTVEPPDAGGLVYQVQHHPINYDSWEQARLDLTFPAPDIKYVPETFQLSNTVLFSDESGQASKAVLFYHSDSRNASYQLTLRMLEPGEVLATSSDIAGGHYEEVQIGSQNGFLFTDASGRASLDFMRGPLVVSISGSLSKEELQRVANGLS